MALPAEKPRDTFADALTWEEHAHIELIGGAAYLMAPPLRAPCRWACGRISASTFHGCFRNDTNPR